MVQATTAEQYTELSELYSNRAKMAGPGMVGLDPRSIRSVISFSGGYPDASTLPIQDRHTNTSAPHIE